MKKLRSGYTTGACAAAAAKAAAETLATQQTVKQVIIPFPTGNRIPFSILWSKIEEEFGVAAVVKDAGDDPDVTNGATIIARVRELKKTTNVAGERVIIRGGTGVGVVTKPGLPVEVGKPAINPIPARMISEAVMEIIEQYEIFYNAHFEITIVVPDGERLAKNTLNSRLGILGGISILGTTGIVKPVSADAWTATIASSMSVASAVGITEIILSTGRTSERCVQNHLGFPEESLVMMGDYLEFSLKETQKHSYQRIHIATMWAKLLKGAMAIPQTHVRHGALDTGKIVEFFKSIRVDAQTCARLEDSNTAREVLDRLLEMEQFSIVELVCGHAKMYYQSMTKQPVTIHLVKGTGTLLCSR